MSISKWLDMVAIKQHQIERNAANYNAKNRDNTFDTLMELYEKGYDMVTWVVTDHEAKCDLCKFYGSHQTTWRLAEFLNLDKFASYRADITITAAIYEPWNELDDSDKLAILRTPQTAYNYAKHLGYVDVPEEVIEKISENETVSEYFLEGFLSTTEEYTVPLTIIDAVGGDAPFVDRLFRELGGQKNYPEQLKFRGMTEKEVALMDQEDFNISRLKHNAPLFEHSHVGCKCQLLVWKSYDPTEVVYVDAAGK